MPNSNWNVITTKPQRERAAAVRLVTLWAFDGTAPEVYLPLQHDRKLMFPGYLFARCEAGQRRQVIAIASDANVQEIIGQASDAEIAAVRDVESRGGMPSMPALRKGDACAVRLGTAVVEGKIERLLERSAWVSVVLLSRAFSVPVLLSELEAV